MDDGDDWASEYPDPDITTVGMSGRHKGCNNVAEAPRKEGSGSTINDEDGDDWASEYPDPDITTVGMSGRHKGCNNVAEAPRNTAADLQGIAIRAFGSSRSNGFQTANQPAIEICAYLNLLILAYHPAPTTNQVRVFKSIEDRRFTWVPRNPLSASSRGEDGTKTPLEKPDPIYIKFECEPGNFHSVNIVTVRTCEDGTCLCSNPSA
ncbi:hypothetical protein J6590_007076 [Homalodisca vitripennis]|nr:hypothetical protein J6590_007076 [Homalodisca vitripennis]